MRNYVQPGNTLTVPSPAAVASGDLVVIGNLIGVAAGDAAAGDPLDLTVEGVFELPKIGANAFAVGDRVFWSAADELATSTVGANARIGTAIEAAAASTTTVNVRLVSI